MNELRLASLACGGAGGVEASLDRAREMIARACDGKPDVICLPELFAWSGLDAEQKRRAAEPIGGAVSGEIASLAAKHSVNICAPVLERDGDAIFNAMIWLDRKGKTIGKYRKVVPTDYEMAEGISPGGGDFEIFATEFGPVGCCVCFDLNFRHVVERNVNQAAKLVLFPTMFQGLALMCAWVRLCRVYFASAAGDPYAAVVDPLGRVLVAPWEHDPILTQTINLDYLVVHEDHNKEKLAAMKQKYREQVAIDMVYIESAALVWSRHPTMSAASLAEEFGIESESQYLERSRSLACGKDR